MSLLLRQAEPSDIKSIVELAKSFSLLNLPAEDEVISEKVNRSVKSFAGKMTDLKDAEYFFVVYDTETKKIAGTSLLLAKHGTEEFPHTYFDVSNKERYSKELGIGFIHQVLKLSFDTDGPSEIGGLLVDGNYRRRPEKLGKQISLIRFLYLAMHQKKFEDRVLCELTPPLTEDGRSEFWEALGRKFTGLPYQEADFLSQKNNKFIRNLFPEELIYTCTLEAKARYMIGRVGLSTLPAKHLLESIGFKYLNQIDPFDGGPHFGAPVSEISIVKKSRKLEVSKKKSPEFNTMGLVGHDGGGEFKGCMSYFEAVDKKVILPEATKSLLDVANGDKVFVTPI